MIPIGILTRNRAVYLDATLRSLSATRIPRKTPLTVYDDTSDDPLARRYLDTTDTFTVEHRWPRCAAWTEAELDFLPDNPALRGIADRIEVVAVARRAVGVANASCFAIRDLFSRCPDAPGVILLQDDVVFTANWYERLVGQVGSVFQVGLRQGIVAGMHLDHRQKRRITRTSPVRFCSAQCYLIMRELFGDQRAWFDRTDHEPRNFDKWLCKLLRIKGFELRLLYPYVCQHIGVVSKVRPDVAFYRDDRAVGRVGLGSSGVYSTAEESQGFTERSIRVDSHYEDLALVAASQAINRGRYDETGRLGCKHPKGSRRNAQGS